MPELPEVETIRRQLVRAIKGATIKSVEVRNAKPLNVSKEKFISAVSGAKIKDIERRAKLLIFKLTPPASSPRKRGSYVLLFHLKMTGRMLLAPKKELPTKHTYIVFKLSGGRNLFFEDYRKFGFVKLLNKKESEKYFAGQGYGPEPFSKNFVYRTMKNCFFAKPNKKIKALLMEQSCVAGIGNIYASEICFFAGVRPDRKIAGIKENEFKKIFNGTKIILKSAIVSRGSSADSYVDAFGKQGTFVPKLKVYGREGKKCLRCNGMIVKDKVGGRGTYYCPKCQK